VCVCVCVCVNLGSYGYGIYCSPIPATAAAYGRGAGFFVLAVARGRVWKTGYCLGAPLQPNHDSHESNDGQEWVLYSGAQSVPLFYVAMPGQQV
jgi:hypothetical protein